MDRPPRAVPPSHFSNSQQPQSSRPNPKRDPASAVTFQDSVDRNGGGGYAGQGLQSPAGDGKYGDPSNTQYDSYNSLSYQSTADDVGHLESGGGLNQADVKRKKSLVRPDRERIDPNHRQYYYRNHAVQMENEAMGVIPSATGNAPQIALRRGKSVLAREEDAPDAATGLARFKSRKTLRRKDKSESDGGKKRWLNSIPGPHDAWVIYCYIITACLPPPLLSVFGIKTPEQQRAWREKMGLVSIILVMMAGVGFLTFGFTRAVCNDPIARVQTGQVTKSFLIVHGYAYDLGNWNHPTVSGVFNNSDNPLFDAQYNAGGMDASFLFQNVNQHCLGHITLAQGSSILVDKKQNLGWYFPCNLYNQNGTTGPNLSGYDSQSKCHNKPQARTNFAQTARSVSRAQVFYTWDDITNSNRNLAVYESSVLDFSLLNWLDKSQVNYPPLFDQLKTKNGTFNQKDLSMWFLRNGQKDLGACLQDIVTVGFIDTKSIGCVASDVVLYVSLVFIIGVVAIKFVMAVIFGWFVSWKLGSFGPETYQQRMARAREIEDWTDNIHSAAPAGYRPTVKQGGAYYNEKRKTQFFPTQSRFSKFDNQGTGKPRPATMLGTPTRLGANSPVGYGSKTFLGVETPAYRGSRSSTSLGDGRYSSSDPNLSSACPYPLAKGVIPQPTPDYQPYGFPLAHTICLVTAYSESVEGLRTTLDSLATTSYPNSHKLIMVIADGMVKGSGNTMTTPEIVLGMMKDFVIEPREVMAHSYVAIADGHKRHNMAKVYAGFYAYDEATVEPSKQQRVPIVLVAKVGNPLEANEAKPGNRGKRDSQIVLMSFLQKVLFDERMTTFEYEFFNSIWRVTGISPDQYELVLCVDADTKVFPDSLSRMVACMARDEEIMGLCGETKIANKGETWVTMIQVFEYYISHHLTKAFESMFGGVTCLPGCFSMYRIKAPKGREGFWVPILANPDIVEHYSENIVDTLHKKNLLLLGEDRYLTTLMLKTFPKRKMIFCPQAVCKTIVPDTFSVLLSQRRRWINSTVHNLAELLLVRDLCGTFCFSMQFVVFMELAGTLVLPAAISFTIYLIVYTIIPKTNPKPIIPLILLGIILGLPGLLIVVTSRKVEYVGWMFIYLMSLPIWNAVLPAYAFWHFDDFSWGQTRMVAGEKAGENHGDKEGEFDSSHIVMKRWAEFERDRRFKSGTHSRDSTFYDVVQRTGTGSDTPRRQSRRFSVVSAGELSEAIATRAVPFANSPIGYDNEATNSPHYRSRGDLMLPAPLSVAMPPRTKFGRDASPISNATRVDEEAYAGMYDSGSNHRLIPSPGDHAAGQDEQTSSTDHTPPSHDRYASPQPSGVNVAAVIGQQQGLRHGNVASSNYPGETQNPYRYSLPQAASPSAGYYNDLQDDDIPPPTPAKGRGVSLVDNGPVLTGGSDQRRVPRPSARRHSAKPEAPQYSAQAYQEEAPRSRPTSYRPPAGPPPGAASPVIQNRGWNDPRYQ